MLSRCLFCGRHSGTRDQTHTTLHGISGFALRQGDWKYIPATPGASGIGSGAIATDPRFAAASTPSLYSLISPSIPTKQPMFSPKIQTRLEN